MLTVHISLGTHCTYVYVHRNRKYSKHCEKTFVIMKKVHCFKVAADYRGISYNLTYTVHAYFVFLGKAGI